MASPVRSSTKAGYPVCLRLIFVYPKLDFKYEPFCVWIITQRVYCMCVFPDEGSGKMLLEASAVVSYKTNTTF